MTGQALDQLARRVILDTARLEYGALLKEAPEHSFSPSFESITPPSELPENLISTSITQDVFVHLSVPFCDQNHFVWAKLEGEDVPGT